MAVFESVFGVLSPVRRWGSEYTGTRMALMAVTAAVLRSIGSGASFRKIYHVLTGQSLVEDWRILELQFVPRPVEQPNGVPLHP